MIEEIKEAWRKRKEGLIPALERSDTNAYRVFCGEKEGIPGLIADRYDAIIVLTLQEGICRLTDPELRHAAAFFIEALGVRSVYLKRNYPDRSNAVADATLCSPTPLLGEGAPPTLVIRENGLHFLIRPYDGFSTGIFLDQRENRRFLSGLCQGKRALNCFAYTCAFSVGFAKAGARVTSVDLSKRYLEWGKENFALNGLDTAGQVFLARDVFSYFGTALKRKEFFDLIVLDPPSFSRVKTGETFSLKKDFKRLVWEASQLLSPGGWLFFSSNYSAWDPAQVKDGAAAVLSNTSWNWKLEPLPEIPMDFRSGSNPLCSFLIRRGD